MNLDRRTFLQGAAALSAVPGIGGLVARLALEEGELDPRAANQRGGYGRLRKAKAENTGEELLALPEGFKYTVFGKTGDLMTDGLKTPRAHDGMAAFAHNGKVRLVRNHEVRNRADQPEVISSSRSYDLKAGGGTTTLDIDPETRLPVAMFASISGTMVNCAGGPTPWGSWITCEETVVGAAQGFDKEHGYCFEVSALSDGLVDPTPIREMGRFVHEACCVDPATSIVYLTEDRQLSGLYRFIPNKEKDMKQGGRLQMLAVKGKSKFDTRKGQKMGAKMDAVWVAIDTFDPAPSTEELGAAVYTEGLNKGAATFARLEGCWWGNGSVYVTSTNGGDKNLGQVWRYIPGTQDEGVLELVFESPNASVMESPDNLCVTPRGGLAVCEDGQGTNYVRGVTAEGRAFDFARNLLNESEFAGVVFSPDGKTMFVNIQNPGLTLAIWGDFQRGPF